MAGFRVRLALDRFTARTGLQSDRLSRRKLFAYSLAESPMQMVSLPVGVFLPAFYAQELGLGLAAVGMILMVARLWDVVTDPVIGYLSDRTKTRFGRRKPWILVSIPLVMLSVQHLFVPGEAVSNTYLLVWTMLLWMGWTLFNIPYFAWGAELSSGYTERTRITGWRTMLGFSGGMLAVLLPAASQMFLDYGGTSGEALEMIADVVVWMMPVCAMLLLAVVPEQPNFVPPKIELLPGLKMMWAQPSVPAAVVRLHSLHNRERPGFAGGRALLQSCYRRSYRDAPGADGLLRGQPGRGSVLGVARQENRQTPYLAGRPGRFGADFSRLHVRGRGGSVARGGSHVRGGYRLEFRRCAGVHEG